jgi:DNA replication and repair protein RecF
MGKTNLLDAVYYLCMGKSYFNLPDRLICRHDTDFFRLEGHFELEGRPEHIAAKVRPRQKKELERNKVPYHRLSEHVGLLPIVMIAPDDTYLATEGSEARRRFLDNTLSQLDAVYLNQLILYNKILKQRNALLKRAGETRRLDKALLDTYTYQLLKPGQYIYQRRSEFMEQFQPRLQQLYEEISGGQEQVGIQYRSKLADAPLEQLLQSSEEKDRLLQRTTAGPHKDDLEFDIQEYPLKRFASQGQLKSYVLALKLAQYQVLRAEKKLSPFLLLDDIFDKLDNNRVSQLLGVLLQKEYGQLFITDTDDQRLKHIIEQYEQSYTQYTIEHGKAEQTAGK